ncbi:unannotated protein [freshwater metagenome]|uniref:Unannotated protein n=1 Tax=freshwater metagenome TaxID=449393 RepID=A0A6J7SZS4_9ZZZZ
MERTKPFLLTSASIFELDIIADDFINGSAFTDVGNILIIYATAHGLDSTYAIKRE